MFIAILASLLALTAAPAAFAQQAVPDGFCENLTGIVYNAENPLPADQPCEGVAYEVEFYEHSYDSRVRNVWPLTWNQVKAGISGKVWAHPLTQNGWVPGTNPAIGMTEAGLTVDPSFVSAPPAATATRPAPAAPTATRPAASTGTSAATATRVAPLATPVAVQLVTGACSALPTRIARLHCATELWRDAGEGFEGFDEAAASLGASWDLLFAEYPSDAWQPDTSLIANQETVWGGLVRARNLQVTGNSCLVTDQPELVESFGWAVQDLRYDPPVWHFGYANTANDLTVDIALHLGCDDWQEIKLAMTEQAVVVINEDGDFAVDSSIAVGQPVVASAPVAYPAPAVQPVAPALSADQVNQIVQSILSALLAALGQTP